MSFPIKRLTKDQSIALGRVAEQVRQSLDGGSLVPELPQSVHSLLREPTETHGPDETVDELYKTDFIAIKHKVMRLLNQGGEREKFCEEVGRHLDQLSDPKARALDAAARREGIISAGVHNEPDRNIIASKAASADKFIRNILKPRLVVHTTRRPPSPRPPLHQSSSCDLLEFEAALLDGSKTTAGCDNMNTSARSVARICQVPATSNVIVIPDEDDTPDSIAPASSQSASNRHSVSAPDAAILAQVNNTSAKPQQPISGPSSTASVVQFLTGTDPTAAQAVDQQSRVSSALNNPFSLGKDGLLAVQQQSRNQRVTRHMWQQRARSPHRTKQCGYSLSRQSISRPAGGHWAKKRKIGPERLARDAHPILPNTNSLTGNPSNSVGDTQSSYGTEQVDVEAKAQDISTIGFSLNLNSRPNRDLGPQNPEGRIGMEPRDVNVVTCDEPSNRGQMIEPEPPILDPRAVAQPKSEDLDTATGFKTDGGNKEMSYTRNLLRKLVEVIEEVDAHKKAAEAKPDTQGKDQAETEAIYSMYVQFNDILHKQQRL